MKISKIFHWLYFTVMMLPCVIIPIFAIYTRNENYNSNIEIERYENKVVDFNQLYNASTSTSTYYGITRTPINGNGINLSGTLQADNIYTNVSSQTLNIVQGHKYAINGASAWKSQNANNMIHMPSSGSLAYLNTDGVYTASVSSTPYIYVLINSNGQVYDFDLYISLFDLTQMYGAGNEPTYNEFLIDFPSLYYAPTTSERVVIESQTPTTYNDTDIGSQFVYTLYNATDKYFNFDNFFGLDNVYSWIQLNWFSGNAPLGFAIFWHFFTYWLLASLAWLLFDLMVYVPLYIHRWLDKGAIE